MTSFIVYLRQQVKMCAMG